MSKAVKILFISMFIVLILLAAGLYFYFVQMTKDASKEPTIDEIIDYSVEVPELTTNLLDGDYIKITFTIETNSEDAKEELEKRDFQTENIIVKQLSGMEASAIEGTDGKTKLEDTLKDQLNTIMDEGKIVQVYITSVIIQ